MIVKLYTVFILAANNVKLLPNSMSRRYMGREPIVRPLNIFVRFRVHVSRFVLFSYSQTASSPTGLSGPRKPSNSVLSVNGTNRNLKIAITGKHFFFRVKRIEIRHLKVNFQSEIKIETLKSKWSNIFS